MESLFDLIFGNIWVIAIIIGIVSSMFKKKKEKQSEPKRTGTPTAPINQKPVREQNPRYERTKTIRQFYEEAKKSMEAPRPAALETEHEAKPATEVWAKEQELKKQESERTRKMQPKSVSAVRNEISDHNSPVYQTNFEITQQKVMDGIIMAEVLGPPRAKNRPRLGRRL
ncbi:hypothetical protein [Peribacillus loiseleuriae]|uniref:Uncharacterized protein n=1 Tax=Peribacillus loiseleuriae TaxID=1679170 RepID=A0A0K9GW34_9BACI|nr:hypothetical protein [Peribacillus loiseleuriae]KMY50846.1 hypothetical protein AC625_16060 [Peribacillus loiseleuriae]